MKKVFSLIIAIICLFSVMGCGGSKDGQKQVSTGDKVKDSIIKVCKDTLGHDFVSVDVVDNLSNEPGAKGTKNVSVIGKIREGTSDEKTRVANIIQARSLFKALYTSGQPIGRVIYFVEADLVDNYGKKGKGNAFKFTLSKKIADKFDWNSVIEIESFPSLIDNTWMLPQFRK